MKTTTKVILGVGGVAVLGIGTYYIIKSKSGSKVNRPNTPPPPPPPPQGGGNNIDLYVKTFDDLLNIFTKPKNQIPTSSLSEPEVGSEAGYF